MCPRFTRSIRLLDRISHSSLGYAIAAGLHAVIALWAMARGMTFMLGVSHLPHPHPTIKDATLDVWEHVWHALPLDVLQGNQFWSTLWLDHAQPPGFSIWVWAVLKVFGRTHMLTGLQLSYIALGTGAVIMAQYLTGALTRSRRWGLAAGLAMALNPALLYYESYFLYDIIVLFLMLGSSFCLWKGLAGGDRDLRTGVCKPQPENRRWLALMIITLNILVMTRSLFHLVFLIAALGFLWPMWRRLGWRRSLALVLLSVCVPLTWYGKKSRSIWFLRLIKLVRHELVSLCHS